MKKFEECNILKMHIKSIISKISIVWCFSSRTPPKRQFYKNYSQNHFFFKKVDFCIFNPKNFEVKENCSKTLLIVCPLKCTYIGKNYFSFISFWSEIMSLKSDRLELGFSIVPKFVTSLGNHNIQYNTILAVKKA